VAVTSRLLIVNYVMDSENPLLSHQQEAVYALSKNFEHVTVITGKVGANKTASNVEIVNTHWNPGQRIRNMLRFLIKTFPLIIRGDFNSVFFHMTDLQCAILSPLVRLQGKKQFLWYAHTSKSFFLRWSSLWVNLVVTSTSGSCPIKNKKVMPIGQAIDDSQFTKLSIESMNLNKLIHIGRFDKSKQIESLIQAARELRESNREIELKLVGSPANDESKTWAKDLVLKYRNQPELGWLKFEGSIPRNLFRKKMEDSGCFFHAYTGSLDKTLVESTMLCVPVITVNPEYVSIFGAWSKADSISLVSEYKAMRSLNSADLELELNRRHSLALENHSLDNWISQLSRLLK
jgi:glycosyltransferase involved in cell wall biosynthesis